MASDFFDLCAVVELGSVQIIGYRSLPLVELMLSPRWSLEVFGAVEHAPLTSWIAGKAPIGFTRTWR